MLKNSKDSNQIPRGKPRGMSPKTTLVARGEASRTFAHFPDFLHSLLQHSHFRVFQLLKYSNRLTKILLPKAVLLLQVLGQRSLEPLCFSRCERSLSEHMLELTELENEHDLFLCLSRESEFDIVRIYRGKLPSLHCLLYLLLLLCDIWLDKLNDKSERSRCVFCG